MNDKVKQITKLRKKMPNTTTSSREGVGVVDAVV
jgi:hypothetical protein